MGESPFRLRINRLFPPSVAFSGRLNGYASGIRKKRVSEALGALVGVFVALPRQDGQRSSLMLESHVKQLRETMHCAMDDLAALDRAQVHAVRSR